MRRALAALLAAGLLAPAAAAAQEPATAGPQASAALALSAPSAVLVQPATGDVVYARRAGQRRQIASTTKLMTVLLALERRRLRDRMTVVPYAALPVESVAGLRAGERLSVADLVRALLIASANDAAATVAQNIGGSQRGFVRLMNQRARRAGLRNTSFSNPIGLDGERNFSTATDLAKLALLVRRSPFARDVMDRPVVTLRTGARPRTLRNRNTLVGAVPWMDGVKTGHTNRAGYLLVGSASRGGVELVSVVMGTPSEAARNADTLALMRYGFARYTRRTPVVAGRVVTRLPVRDQPDVRVGVAARSSARVVVRRGKRLQVRLTGLPAELEGPVAKGTRVGQAVVRRSGRVVARVPLVTTAGVERASLWQRSHGWLGPLAVLGLLALAALAAGSLLRARRGDRRGRRGARSETA